MADGWSCPSSVITPASSNRRSGWRSRRSVLALTGVIVFLMSLQTAAAERITLGAIGFYRAHGSSVARRYAELAVQKYGVVHGLAKTSWRLARCNPLTSRRGETDYP